jgi:hypothetical protein
MTTKRCEICGGARVVRLARFYQAVQMGDEPVLSAPPPYNTYPCPECAPQVAIDRVAVLDAHSIVGPHRPWSEIGKTFSEKYAAHALIERVLRGGFISFEQGPPDSLGRSQVVATLGVVSKNAVASLEARIAERQGEVAVAAGAQSIKDIDNWGSAYGDGMIRKDRAADLIREAVKRVIETWSKIKERTPA